jgi:hypothetical protein
MALTVTKETTGLAGNQYRIIGTIAFDSSYPTGGESLTAANVGLTTLNELELKETSGYTFQWDKANAKVKVYAMPQRFVAVNSTSTDATGTTSEQNLATATLTGGVLAVNGDAVEIIASGITAANTNTKILKLYFGSQILVTTATAAANNKDWVLRGTVVRTGAATQEAVADGQHSATLTGATRSAPTETLASDVTIKVTATLGTASATDVTQKLLVVRAIPLAASTATAAQTEVANTTDLSALTAVRFEALGV